MGIRVVQGGGVACQAGHVAEVSVNKISYFWALIIRKSVDMCWQRICVQCSIGHRYGDKVKCGCIIVLYKCEIFLSSMTRKVYIAEYVVVLYLSQLQA